MHATATTDNGRFELRGPRTGSEWKAYHSLRERSFWAGLGLDRLYGSYDASQSDQRGEHYTPLILMRNGIMVGTLGLQDMGEGIVQLRGVGVEPACQRRGYGSVMLAMAEDGAQRHGFQRAWVYSHETAVMFYAGNAYTHGGAHDLNIPPCPIPGSVTLAKRLGHGRLRPCHDMLIAAA